MTRSASSPASLSTRDHLAVSRYDFWMLMNPCRPLRVPPGHYFQHIFWSTFTASTELAEEVALRVKNARRRR